MFVWGAKLEKILKMDEAPEMYLVGVCRIFRRACPRYVQNSGIDP